MLVLCVAGGEGGVGAALVRRCSVEQQWLARASAQSNITASVCNSSSTSRNIHEHRSTRTTCNYFATAMDISRKLATTPPAIQPCPWPAPAQRSLSLQAHQFQSSPSNFAHPRPGSPSQTSLLGPMSLWEPTSSKLCPCSIQCWQSWWSSKTRMSRWEHTRLALGRRLRLLGIGRLQA